MLVHVHTNPIMCRARPAAQTSANSGPKTPTKIDHNDIVNIPSITPDPITVIMTTQRFRLIYTAFYNQRSNKMASNMHPILQW